MAKFSVVVVVFNGISIEFFLDGGSLGSFFGGSHQKLYHASAPNFVQLYTCTPFSQCCPFLPKQFRSVTLYVI